MEVCKFCALNNLINEASVMEFNISMFCKKVSCLNRFYFVRSGIIILLLRCVCKTLQILLFVTLSVVVCLQISNCTKYQMMCGNH